MRHVTTFIGCLALLGSLTVSSQAVLAQSTGNNATGTSPNTMPPGVNDESPDQRNSMSPPSRSNMGSSTGTYSGTSSGTSGTSSGTSKPNSTKHHHKSGTTTGTSTPDHDSTTPETGNYNSRGNQQ